MIKKVNSAFD